ncbi:MAG: glycosyltransferase [Roseiflexaceae bacterium]|nr:glycosyltransferase [Roseiflexaceae bacterium]
MRVLQVVEATTAGVRRHVQTLASTIDRRRYTLAVACPPVRAQAFGDSLFVADLQRAAVPVHAVPMLRAISPATDIHALRQLVQLIHAEQIDLVHAHSSKAGVLGRVAARAAGVPSVYTPHSLHFLGIQNPAKRVFFLLLEQLAARLGDRIIAVSPGEHALMLAHHIARPEQISCIENGIVAPQLPASYDRVAMRAALGQSSDAALIGTVARCAAQKNPRLFVEAAAALLRDLPTARFVWCGGGELQAQAEQWAAARGIGHAVRFLGHREDVAALMGALDLFWLTSNYEGLPTAPIEAMLLGVPVIATDVVGTRDLLKSGAGLLVPPGDAQALARTSFMLVQRRDRREALARAARRIAAERWDAARMACETAALYDQVTTAHADRPRWRSAHYQMSIR